MQNFTFYSPTEVVFGRGAEERCAEYVKKYGGSRVLVVYGGGQPLQPSVIRNFSSVSAMRSKALYHEDANMPLRKSHENPLIREVYETFLGQAGGEKAHHLLHTSYVDRSGLPK